MNKRSILLFLTLCLGFGPAAFAQGSPAATARARGVQTKKTQAAMTIPAALKLLKDGNNRFVAGKLINQKRYRKQVPLTAKGQYPYAAILSCLDSRVGIEQIFDLNNGDVFNGRIAGNVMNPDMLGSFEFATKLYEAKIVLVLGHSDCGAVKGACDFFRLGNLTGLLMRIEPAVELIGRDWRNGEKNSKNPAFVEAVGEANVRLVIKSITKGSPVMKELVDAGKILIVGGIYDLKTGKVRFLS